MAAIAVWLDGTKEDSMAATAVNSRWQLYGKLDRMSIGMARQQLQAEVDGSKQ